MEQLLKIYKIIKNTKKIIKNTKKIKNIKIKPKNKEKIRRVEVAKMRELIKKLTPNSLIELYKKLRYAWITLLFHAFHLCKIKKNRVVFCNVWGFGDNTKYIAEALEEYRKREKIKQNCQRQKGILNSFFLPELIFITNRPEKIQDSEIKMVRTNSISAIFFLATAHIWVDSNRKEAYIKKRKGQYYIQTWHGGLPLKKIEGDCADYLGEAYRLRAKRDSEMTDLYLSNGGFCTQMYRRAFWYSGEIFECGTPRIDRLINKDIKREEKIRNTLNILPHQKVAIYAPTYREQKDTKSYLKQLDKVLETLEKKFSSDFVLLVRLHPLAAGLNNMYQYNDKIIDVSYYRDMYELLEIIEVLITDYSNTMFEVGMIKKKVFLFTKDLEEYGKNRGFYFSFDELPFPTAKTQEELIENILNFNLIDYQRKTKQFFKTVNLVEEGSAAQQAVTRILKELKKNHKKS